MKKQSLFRFVAALGILLAVAFAPVAALAQDTAPASSGLPVGGLFDFLSALVVAAAVKYPIITTIVAAMGLARAIFKPVTLAIETYVKSTVSTKDDEVIAKVEASWAYKAFAWVLDWGASIKVGPQKGS